MSDVVIRTSGLTKDYGQGRGVFDLDLEVHRGEVLGYLGPNGAGKSTTIRMLLDMVRPTSGSAEVLGQDPRLARPSLRARLSYIPGELSLWRGWTGAEIIGYLGSLRGGFDGARVADLAGRFQLDLSRTVAQLSKGNKQKVGLVALFAPRSELLIMDEPTSGLDPLLQMQFQQLVREAVADGASVLLSSHVLSEVEGVAGRVAIIRSGRLVDVLGMAQLRAKASQTVEVTFAEAVPPQLGALEGIDLLVADGVVARYEVTGSMDTFIKALATHTVIGLRGHDADLEQVFLRYYADPADPDPRSGLKGPSGAPAPSSWRPGVGTPADLAGPTGDTGAEPYR
ncbi:MAG TPA: ABC transporter ATP-binding protein [Euzebya sp.]|nr:ABC transporter ATP-binding protein [Euzebya sp.]